jgi:hypothetical protein
MSFVTDINSEQSLITVVKIGSLQHVKKLIDSSPSPEAKRVLILEIDWVCITTEI